MVSQIYQISPNFPKKMNFVSKGVRLKGGNKEKDDPCEIPIPFFSEKQENILKCQLWIFKSGAYGLIKNIAFWA